MVRELNRVPGPSYGKMREDERARKAFIRQERISPQALYRCSDDKQENDQIRGEDEQWEEEGTCS